MHLASQAPPRGSIQTATCKIGPEVLPLQLQIFLQPRKRLLLHSQPLPGFRRVKPMTAPPLKNSPHPRISVTLNGPMRFSHQFNS